MIQYLLISITNQLPFLRKKQSALFRVNAQIYRWQFVQLYREQRAYCSQKKHESILTKNGKRFIDEEPQPNRRQKWLNQRLKRGETIEKKFNRDHFFAFTSISPRLLISKLIASLMTILKDEAIEKKVWHFRKSLTNCKWCNFFEWVAPSPQYSLLSELRKESTFSKKNRISGNSDRWDYCAEDARSCTWMRDEIEMYNAIFITQCWLLAHQIGLD